LTLSIGTDAIGPKRRILIMAGLCESSTVDLASMSGINNTAPSDTVNLNVSDSVSGTAPDNLAQ